MCVRVSGKVTVQDDMGLGLRGRWVRFLGVTGLEGSCLLGFKVLGSLGIRFRGLLRPGV